MVTSFKYFEDLSKNSLYLNKFKDALLNETVPIAITFNHHSLWKSSEKIHNEQGFKFSGGIFVFHFLFLYTENSNSCFALY